MICMGRHCLVKCCIEDCNLGYRRAELAGYFYSNEICRVVQRCQGYHAADGVDDFVDDQSRLPERLAAVNDAMADACKLIKILDNAEFKCYVEDELESFTVVGY